MKIARKLILAALPVALLGCAGMTLDDAVKTGLQVSQASSSGSTLNYAEAIKETLKLSSTRAASKLSAAGGYANDPLYRITMPANLSKITGTLRTFGLGKQVDRVEALMNQGAEQAAVEAKAVFVDAVLEMTITDAVGIVKGSNTAATDYFKAKTEAKLRTRYQPIIQQNLSKVGFYNQYKSLLSSYNALPIPNKPDLDLEKHVLDQSLAGLFTQVAKEEAAIRQDPVGKGNELLGRIFSKR